MSLKPKIQFLSDQTASQIAAGEVIERPSYLVKELVENSIDAEASKIEIHFDQSGRTIHIKDNGIGIQKEELNLALQRHATSKIKNFPDLLTLKSFGFRGEALASAMAVSRLTLISRTKESQKAYQLISQFGKISSIKEVAGETGTLILIEDLFSNVPARLKFLKSEVTEFQQIKKTLKALALAHPEVHFQIKSKNKLVYLWPKAHLLSRARMVLEREDLFYNELELEEIHIKALLGSPNKTLSHSKGLWFFVLNRWIQDQTIHAALMQAYDRLLMKKEFPVACIFIESPPSFFDVNIHPNKSQIKFKNNALIFKAVHRCVRDGLSKAFWLDHVLKNEGFKNDDRGGVLKNKNLKDPQILSDKVPDTQKDVQDIHFQKKWNQRDEKIAFSSDPTSSFSIPHQISDSNFSKKDLRAPKISKTLHSKQDSFFEEKAFFEVPKEGDSQKEKLLFEKQKMSQEFKSEGSKEETKRLSWASLSVIGQVKLTYIVAQTEKSILFLDQHALHERLNYEKYQKIWKSKKGFKRQNFLLPYDIELKEEDVHILTPKLDQLLSLGIQADIAGPSLIVVRSAFSLIKPKSFRPLFELLVRELRKYGESFALEKMIGDIFSSLACHSSIRAGQALSHLEMQNLLAEMDDFPFSSFCPHGRPVYVEYPFHRLEKDFKRTL